MHYTRASCWLIAVDTDTHPCVFALGDTPLTIGRAPESTVIVPVATVSRRHLRIKCDGERVVVHDAQSANGTFINGRRITAPHPLDDEDLISLGADGPLFQFLARHWLCGGRRDEG
jgi:pSer/pThr/pTyr-binding forkhead associated (FHA) protein